MSKTGRIGGLAFYRDVYTRAGPGRLAAFGIDRCVGHIVGTIGGHVIHRLIRELQLGRRLDWLSANVGPVFVILFGGGGAFKAVALLYVVDWPAGLGSNTIRALEVSLRSCQKIHLPFRRDIRDRLFGDYLRCWPSLESIPKFGVGWKRYV